MRIMFGLLVSLQLVMLLTGDVVTAAVIYNEDFSGQEGKGAIGPGPTIDLAGVPWSIDVSNADLADQNDFFHVVNGEFVAQDLDGLGATWFSPLIDISQFTNVGFSLTAAERGDLESADFFDVIFILDGGPATLIADWNGLGSAIHTLVGDWTSETVSLGGFGGSTLQLAVDMLNNAATEQIVLDDIEVTGTPRSSGQIPEPTSLLVWSLLACAAYRVSRSRARRSMS